VKERQKYTKLLTQRKVYRRLSTTCGHEPYYAKGLCRECYHHQPKWLEYAKKYREKLRKEKEKVNENH
jgi:uncharacterized OB-fold protein